MYISFLGLIFFTVLEAGSPGPRPRVQEVWFLLRPRSGLAGGLLLAVSSHGLSFVHASPWCLSVCPNLIFLEGHQADWIRIPP